jgi:hypothetical protein
MTPDNWAREVSAEIVMGVSDGLSRKLGFAFDDDAKVEFAKDIYPSMLDIVRRIQNDALEQAAAAEEANGRPDSAAAIRGRLVASSQ